MSDGPRPIHAGRQGKHLRGHPHFIEGRSELTVDPMRLADRQGTGEAANAIPRGAPGHKERVDFGEVIGVYVDPATGGRSATTKGIIHHGADGIHIVPARP